MVPIGVIGGKFTFACMAKGEIYVLNIIMPSRQIDQMYLDSILSFRYVLAGLHAFWCVVSPVHMLKLFMTFCSRRQAHAKKNIKETKFMGNKWIVIGQVHNAIGAYLVNPILVGLALYGSNLMEEWGIRLVLSFAIVNTSYLFLGSLSMHPIVGSFTNMLSKVQI